MCPSGRRAEAAHRHGPPADQRCTVEAARCRLLLHRGFKTWLALLSWSGTVSCTGCDPANELNRLRRLWLSLLGFCGWGGIWDSPSKVVHRDKDHSVCVVTSEIVEVLTPVSISIFGEVVVLLVRQDVAMDGLQGQFWWV